MSSKSKVLNEDVVAKIDAVIAALRDVKIDTEEEKKSVDARVAVLEWLKSGRSGKLHVDEIEKK